MIATSMGPVSTQKDLSTVSVVNPGSGTQELFGTKKYLVLMDEIVPQVRTYKSFY